MDKVKAKIQSLCLDVKGRCASHDYHHANCMGCAIDERDITLAVVLRAIEKSYMARGISKAFLTSEQLWTVYGLWNLEKDRWEDQTKETQLFIGSLLGVV